MIISANSKLSGVYSQCVAAFAATISCIPGGMQYGWTSPIIPVLQTPGSPVAIKKHETVWIENSYMIGAFIGIPITIFTLNKFGRKNSILIASAQSLVTWIIIALATSVEALYVARVLAGIAGNACFVSTPMYIGEISDRKIRGFLSSWVYLMMLIGIVIVYSVAPFVPVVASSAVGAAFLVLQFVTLPFMPDSPYYLLLEGKHEAARTSIEKLRSRENVEHDLTEITSAVERQKQEQGRIVDLFTIPSNRKAMVIMTVLNGAQHFGGISVLIMNIHTILADAASILSPTTAAIVFSVVMLISATISSGLVDKCGRKLILVISSIISGISLIALAAYFAVKNLAIDVSEYSWVPVVAVMVYAAAFKYGLGMVPIVLTSELFPTSVKAMGMTFADAVYVIASMISVYLYQFVADALGRHIPFIIFGICCFLTTVYIIYCIPETKGKTLEEIQLMLKGNKINSNTTLSTTA